MYAQLSPILFALKFFLLLYSLCGYACGQEFWHVNNQGKLVPGQATGPIQAQSQVGVTKIHYADGTTGYFDEAFAKKWNAPQQAPAFYYKDQSGQMKERTDEFYAVGSDGREYKTQKDLERAVLRHEALLSENRRLRQIIAELEARR